MNPTDDNRHAVNLLLAADFSGSDPNGAPMTREQFVAQGERLMKSVRTTACYNATVWPSSVTSGTVVTVNTMHVEGTLLSSVSSHDVVVNETTRDTWENADGEWIVSQTHEVKIVITIDGRVLRS